MPSINSNQPKSSDNVVTPTGQTSTVRLLNKLGRPVNRILHYVGGLAWLVLDILAWVWKSAIKRQVRFGRTALYTQLMRLGVRALGVIVLVSAAIGLILTLQMSPPLSEFGQTDRVANIIGIAVTRELGPLISAIVLTGFAGASIAAELGTMVVGEEIEALEAHALNPVRFLVMPRVLATTLSMIVLCVIGDLVAIAASWMLGITILDIPSGIYLNNMLGQVDLTDFFTGLCKAGVFGLLIGVIACYNGLRVRGGAAGVGLATTWTVVLSILLIILTDLIFTAVFYTIGWN